MVIFSGGETKATEQVVQDAQAIQQGGGFGSIIGRNFFQRPKREALKMLSEIVKTFKKE
jgi:class I fructose-bisphosphate aldolase